MVKYVLNGSVITVLTIFLTVWIASIIVQCIIEMER